MALFKGNTPTDGTFANRIRKAGEHRLASVPLPKPSHLHEKRMEREPVYANATLIHPHGKISAVVTNLNALGARVEFTTHVPLIGDIRLIAPLLGLNHHVRVAWQKAGSAGLYFVKDEAGAG